MDKSELEALLARIDVWLLVFGVIVVIGVAGESFFGIRHWWNSRKLQRIQQVESENLRSEIARLSNETADANARAADANRKAEEERLARVKIEERLAPRQITTEQANKLAIDAAPLKGKIISFFFIAGTTEVEVFANRLADILRGSGITVRMSPGMQFGGLKPGFSIQANMTRIEEAKILAKALMDAGLTRGLSIQESKIPEELTLTIGPKD